MGLPDRPPINIAPNLAPLRIPPPGVTLPSMANIQVSGIQTTHIHPHDVLCGRGGGTNNHNGNEKFRELVTQQKVLYLHSSKRDKPFVSRGIVRAVRAQNPPGRFLQKDELTGLWYDIGDQKAREKTSQALREGAPEIRREITVTSTTEPTPPLRPQIIPPSGFASASPGVQPLAPAMTPNLAQLRQMQLHRKMEDADFANRRAVAALGYPAHLAAMVAAGRGTMGQTGGSMGQHVSAFWKMQMKPSNFEFLSSIVNTFFVTIATSHDGIQQGTVATASGTLNDTSTFTCRSCCWSSLSYHNATTTCGSTACQLFQCTEPTITTAASRHATQAFNFDHKSQEASQQRNGSDNYGV